MNPLLERMGITERDLFLDLLSSQFIVDFGVVKSVSSDKKKVDVRHAVRPKVRGRPLGETVTTDVEVLWPSSAELSVRWDLAAGDTVLLVGLKDYVRTVDGVQPDTTDVRLHYVQETMKAVPLGAYRSGSTHTIEASGAKLKIDGGGAGAARKGDSTLADLTTDPTNFTYLQTVCLMFGMPLSGLTGKVTGGSDKVEVG